MYISGIILGILVIVELAGFAKTFFSSTPVIYGEAVLIIVIIISGYRYFNKSPRPIDYGNTQPPERF